MIIIPAIDLMNGLCVRLLKGEKKNVTYYEKDPIEIASEYSQSGAGTIHVVDLDGAFTGEMKNIKIISQLAERFPIQVGGGIRSEEKIQQLLDIGVKKVVASTILLGDQQLANDLKKKYYGKLIGSFDFKDGKLSYAGWVKQADICFEDASAGLSEIIITDIERDGTLSGPNIELLKSVKSCCNAKTIAAGGVRGVEDLRNLKQTGIDGAIIGKALLENKMNLKEILDLIG